jgi:RNA polymerase sigma-B factor
MNLSVAPPVDADEFEQIRKIAFAKVGRWWERQLNRPGCLDVEDLLQEAEVGIRRACELWSGPGTEGFRAYAVEHAFGHARHEFRRRHHVGRKEYEQAPRQAPKQNGGRPFALQPLYFSDPVTSGEEGRNSATLGDFVSDPLDRYAAVEIRALIGALPQRSARIITRYHLEGCSQMDLARELGFSQMHVSRLLRAAERQFREVWTQAERG